MSTNERNRHAPIGVIVKTWNTGDCTRLCLDAIGAADLLPEEIVIVDLGSDRETRTFAQDLADRRAIRLRWLPIGHRIAPAVANRQAMEVGATPFVCLLDNDVIVPRNWLTSTVPLLMSPGVGLVAPIRPDPFLMYPGHDDSTEAVIDVLKGRGWPLADIARAYTGGVPLDEFGRSVKYANSVESEVTLEFPSFLSSCCLGLNRAIVEAAGGVADLAYAGGYGSEDVDLSWRVLEAGYAIIRTSDVFVLHLRHASLDANQVDYPSELNTANGILYERWRKRLLGWARARRRIGDSVEDISRRFIIRELIRNTTFGEELEASWR